MKNFAEKMILKDPAEKIMTLEQAVHWHDSMGITGRKLVVTNGCFDLIHRGHVQYLYESRNFGDALLVLINSDASVQALKGPLRPIVDEYNRAYTLASLASVDAVVIFDRQICADELRALAPEVYVKGGDYTLEKLNADERQALQSGGAEFRFIPFVDGFSTTNIIERIKAAESTK